MAPKKKPKSLERVAESVYRRPSGKFVVGRYDKALKKKVFTHPDQPRGGFANLDEAIALRDRLRSETAARAEGTTCGAYARDWTKTDRRGESTNKHHKERLRTFVKDFDLMQMRSVTKRMARLWVEGGPVPDELIDVARGWEGVEEMDGRLIAPGHRGRYDAVRTMWGDAVKDEVVDRSPFAGIAVKRRGREDATMLTAAELDALVEAAGAEWGDFGEAVIGPMIRVAAGTGMRPGELFALRWSAIDWEDDKIAILRARQDRTGKETLPKKNHRREIAMIPMVRAALKRVPRRVGDDRVFYTQQSAGMSARSHWYYWSPVRARFHAGLSPVRQKEIDRGFDFYELRHYFGSYLASLGISPYDIANQMGHKDGGRLAMQLYIHTESKAARDRVQQAVAAAQMAADPSSHTG